MRHLDLFSGIGGFSLAASRVWGSDYENVGFCEIDRYCQELLKLRFGGKIYNDIKELKLEEGSADLITGGFPCQPFSQAGKRKGDKDDRFLWSEMLRVIKEIKPTWVLGENVAGIVKMELDKVLFDLEGVGYETQPFIIPACAINAGHRRNRVWIIANADNRNDKRKQNNGKRTSTKEHFSNSFNENWIEVATRLCGMDDGLPAELDGFKLSKSGHRIERLKALGNAIVPQVAIEIFKAIKEYDNEP